VSDAIYQSDPDAAPDTEFVPGDFEHLVIGNRGRLLDARRTPITVTAVAPATASFEVEIGAFEDSGARWELPLEQLHRFQFALDVAVAPPEAVAELRAAAAKFDRALRIDCDPAAREQTLALISDARASVRGLLARDPLIASLDPSDHIARRTGEPRLYALLEEFLAANDVLELDRRFSATFVSNPGSGELVKGHAIVLAELGLCPYDAAVVRDPQLFEEDLSKPQRARHLIARLAFVHELWSLLRHDTVTLYRGTAVDGPLGTPARSSFVSTTFSRAVAEAHFEGGPATQAAVLWRRRTPVGRLFMTFLETPAMNERFREAEAVVIADPLTAPF
jgi:hypothetical protein